ncbi:cupin domain-containing protein [Mycolicibacterium wolinskyi]|uniref:cupin domain-containing protein n=1 Tax=Mycolicibacterium wolinskyi TaxID=59750 RepID=UPI0039176A67
MTERQRPVVIPLSDVTPIPAAEAPTKVRISRIITRAEHGSNLTQGVCWMDPGEETNRWSSAAENDTEPGDHWYGPVDETYYIIAGTLRFTWDEDVVDLKPGDTVYLAPGWTYHLANVSDQPAFFVYNMTPAQE